GTVKARPASPDAWSRGPSVLVAAVCLRCEGGTRRPQRVGRRRSSARIMEPRREDSGHPEPVSAAGRRPWKGDPMAKIRHVAICAENTGQLAEFYKRTFGMREVRRRPGPAEPAPIILPHGYINLAVPPARQ